MRMVDWLKSWRKNTEIDDDLKSLEELLQEKLVPMDPRPQFVNNLRQNLLQQVANVDLAESSHHQVLQTGLLVTSGILGSIVVIVTGIRGLVSLIGVAGLVIKWLRQNPQGSVTSSGLTR